MPQAHRPDRRNPTASAAPSRRAALRMVLAGAAATGIASLSACGFKLRGQQNFAFTSIFSGFSDTSDMGEQFVQAMAIAAPGVQVITDPAQRMQAQVLLDVQEDGRSKSVNTYNSAGEARELGLHARLKFGLRTQDGRDLIAPTQIEQTRDMSFTESAALAKEYEEESLYRDMDADLVQQLLRRLSAIKSIDVPVSPAP